MGYDLGIGIFPSCITGNNTGNVTVHVHLIVNACHKEIKGWNLMGADSNK